MSVDRPTFTTTITQNDWGLHRKGPIDQVRHQEKVKEAISGQLPGILSDESIITGDGKKIVKLPIRSLELPRFRFDPKNKKDQVGQGNGDSTVGDILGQQGQPGSGPGKGPGAGEIPGIDYYEAEFTIDELTQMVFADLGLPFLEPKAQQEVSENKLVFDDIRKKGPMGNLDRRRMIKNALIRNARETGRASLEPGIRQDDMRFRTWNETTDPTTNAVLIAIRDVSGSMGEFEKYVSRASYAWMLRFLRTEYDKVDTVFITHHTLAKEVDEQAFFGLGESGGTTVAPAYQLALDIIGQRYPRDKFNTYPFHFSDGDTMGGADNERSTELAKKLLENSNQFGYAEVREGGRPNPSSLSQALKRITDPRMVIAQISKKEDIFPALQTFFAPKVAAS